MTPSRRQGSDADQTRWGWLLPRAVLAGAVLIAAATNATAGEPLPAMLAALRQRGLHDVALDYLASLRDSPLLDEESKQSISFEEGCTLVDLARTEGALSKRLATLDEARAKFEAFLMAFPAHQQAASAATQLGNLLVERGRAVRENAANPGQEANRVALLEQAQGLFAEARTQLKAAQDQFEEALRSLARPTPGENRRLTTRRDEARKQLLQARLFAAQSLFESALAYDPGHADRSRLLKEAAAAYQDITEKYPKILGGFYARLWQGRCFQEHGDVKEALAVFDELRTRPEDDDEFRQLKAKALIQALHCWRGDPQQTSTAVEQAADWLTQLRGTEDRTADNLEVRWQLAKALLDQTEAAANDDERGPLRDAALAHAEFLATAAGPRRAEARQLVAQLAQSNALPEPKDFAEAKDQATAVLDRLQLAGNKRKIEALASDADARRGIEAECDAAATQATRLLRLALAFRDAETSLEDVNQVRYYLAYVELQQRHDDVATVLGEFLARRYPQSSVARSAARIALAASLATYNRQGDVDRSFEADRLRSLARFVTEQWPGEPEADEAWLMLGDLAARENRLDEALEHFDRVPPKSPQRAAAELAAAQVAWARYLTAAQPGTDPRLTPKALSDLQSQARARLEGAVTAGSRALQAGGEPTYGLLAAQLSLAQLYGEIGDHQQALKLLDEPQQGVLALVSQGHPLTHRGNFAFESRKAALRSAVGSGQLDRAQSLLTQLSQQAHDDPAGASSVSKLYLALGRELEQQIARLRSSGKTEDLARLLEGFEIFLTKLSETAKEASFDSLQWTADTWYRLGNGLVESGVKAESAQVRKYFAQAGELYDLLLARAKQQVDFLPKPEMLPLFELRAAAALRQGGKPAEALERVLAVLRKNPNQLEAQFEAAHVYQDWGRRDPQYYPSAMAGARPARTKDGREIQLVWGWSRLANSLERFPQHAQRFHEARYNLARCRYELALTQQGEARRLGLAAAERDIVLTARLKADLGGDPWNTKYDALARAIQQASGRPVEGLKAIPVRMPSAQSASRSSPSPTK